MPAEFKFNPWHDPDNGRFTFAGTGKYYGRGSQGPRTRGVRSTGRGRDAPGFPGGGGSGGGGGASGSWDPPAQATKPQPTRENQTAARQTADRPTRVEPGISPSMAKRAADEKWRRVERNGYTYLVDARGRTRHVSGTVTMNAAQPRSRSAQARAGMPDRRPTDDGGHYIARRFNGPTDAFNHFAQNANFNRGRYRKLEEEWAREARTGKRVDVRIGPVYRGSSRRPSLINVWFWVAGKEKSLRFPNERQEKPSAKR